MINAAVHDINYKKKATKKMPENKTVFLDSSYRGSIKQKNCSYQNFFYIMCDPDTHFIFKMMIPTR